MRAMRPARWREWIVATSILTVAAGALGDDQNPSPMLGDTADPGAITAVPIDTRVRPPTPAPAVTCESDPVAGVPPAPRDESDCPYAGDVIVDLVFKAAEVVQNLNKECGETFGGKGRDYQEIIVRYSGMPPNVGLPAMSLELTKKGTKDATRCAVRAAIESLPWSRESRDAWKKGFDAIMELQDAQDLLKKLGDPGKLSLDEQNRLAGLLDRKVYDRLVKGPEKYEKAWDRIVKYLESLVGDENVSQGSLERGRVKMAACDLEGAALELGQGLVAGKKALYDLRVAKAKGERDLECVRLEMKKVAPDKYGDPVRQMGPGPLLDGYNKIVGHINDSISRAAGQEQRLGELASACRELAQKVADTNQLIQDYAAASKIADDVIAGRNCDFAAGVRAVAEMERLEKAPCAARLGTPRSGGLRVKVDAAQKRTAEVDEQLGKLAQEGQTLITAKAACAEIEVKIVAMELLLRDHRCANAFDATARIQGLRNAVAASATAAQDARNALAAGFVALKACDEPGVSRAATLARAALSRTTCVAAGALTDGEISALELKALDVAGRKAALETNIAVLAGNAQRAAVTCDAVALQAIADEQGRLADPYGALCPEIPASVRAGVAEVQALLQSARNTAPAKAAIAAARAAIKACDSSAAAAAIAQLRALGSACGLDVAGEATTLDQELQGLADRLASYEPNVLAAADAVDAAVARCDLAGAQTAMAEVNRLADRPPCTDVPPAVATRVSASFQKVENLKKAAPASGDIQDAYDDGRLALGECRLDDALASFAKVRELHAAQGGNKDCAIYTHAVAPAATAAAEARELKSLLAQIASTLARAEGVIGECPSDLGPAERALDQVDSELLPRAARLGPNCDLSAHRSRLADLRGRLQRLINARADVNAKIVMARSHLKPAAMAVNAKAAKDAARQNVKLGRAMSVPEKCFTDQLRELQELSEALGDEEEDDEEEQEEEEEEEPSDDVPDSVRNAGEVKDPGYMSGSCNGGIAVSTTSGFEGDPFTITVSIHPPFDKIITRVTTNNPRCTTCDATGGNGRFVLSLPFAGQGSFTIEFIAFDKDGKERCRGTSATMTAKGSR